MYCNIWRRWGDLSRRVAWIALLTVTLAGCGHAGFSEVVDDARLPPAFGPPRIERIRDVGGVKLPTAGAWQGESDGIAVPGELLLIEGENFGQLPTVSIGGRATAVVARTGNGGLVARVPSGVPVGDVAITVSHPRGRSTKSFPLRRYAVV